MAEAKPALEPALDTGELKALSPGTASNIGSTTDSSHRSSPSPATSPASASQEGEEQEAESMLKSPRDLLEVWELAQEAFGLMISSSLTSPKWDRRAEAIKGIESMIKSHGLGKGKRQEQTRQILVALRILEQALSDKVWPVLSAALSLLHMVLCHARLATQDRRAALRMLLPILAQRLGDTNTRTHEAHVKAVLECQQWEEAPAATLRVLVESVQSEVAGKATRAFSARLTGCLEVLVTLTRRHKEVCDDGASALVTPIVQIALENSKEKVRMLGLDIAVEFYAAGVELTLRMKASLEEAFQARIAELDCDSGESVGCSDFMVVGTKAPAVREACAAPPLNATLMSTLDFGDDVEALMDTILDDTGVAFQKSGLIKTEGGLDADVDALEAEFLRDLGDLA